MNENKSGYKINRYKKLKTNYSILQRHFKQIATSFKKNRLLFKRLLKNYIEVKKKYIFLRKHSTEKVIELIDEINKEKYQMIFDDRRRLLKISPSFLKEIEMKKDEFNSSFYIDILFDNYLSLMIDHDKKDVIIEPFQFPIMIKNYEFSDSHIHPYTYFRISGKIHYNKRLKSYFYFLTVENISSDVELNYLQKTDSLITSMSITNFNLMKAKKTIEMHKIMLISLICSIVGEYSKETSIHIDNIRQLTTMLMEECNRKGMIKVENYDLEEYIKDINYTSALHDIGKMGIPSYILEKDGQLTISEKEIIKTHPVIGAEYIQKIIDLFKNDPSYSDYLAFLLIPYDICLYHHEKWDGTGYPNNLKGEKIPFPARIVSIVDSYDAMRGYRIYNHRRKSHRDALKEIEKEIGKQFDPNLASVFLNMNEKIDKLLY